MLSIRKVLTRYNSLYNNEAKPNLNINGLMNSLDKNYNFSTIKLLTENSAQISNDEETRMEFLLDKLDEVCHYETENDAKQYTKMICNELGIIKHAKNIVNSVKKRLGLMGSGKAGGSASTVNKNTVNTINNQAKKTSTGNVESGQAKKNKMVNKENEKRAKAANNVKHEDEVKMECYNMILATLDENAQYDRVWKTHNRINERYDTKKIFMGHYYDLDHCVKEFCMLLDTYDVPFRAKVNICLENIAYEYERNNKSLNKSDLVTAITEYFLINTSTFNEEMIREETSNHALIQKITKYGQRLSKVSNTVVSNIGIGVVKVFTSLKNVGKTTGVALLDLLGKVLGGIVICIGTGVLLAGVGIGILVILMAVAIGIIIIIAGVGIAVVISPTLRKQLLDSEKKIKDKKAKKKLSKLNQLIKACETVNPHMKIGHSDLFAEAFCECEYESNKCDIEHVLKTNRFYSEKDIRKGLSLLYDEEDEPVLDIKLEDVIFGFTEENKEIIKGKKKITIKDKVNSLLNLPHKSVEAIKSKIKDMYTEGPDQICGELPNIFRILVDIAIIGGAFAISPILGIVSGMVMWFIALKANREQTEKYIKQFKKEKEKAEKRGSKLSGAAKERNDSYIAELTKSIGKLEDYQDSLHTEEENDERKGYGKEDESSSDSGDSDGLDDFNLDDDDFKIEGCIMNIKLINNAISILENFKAKDFYEYMASDQCDIRILPYIVKEGCSSGLLNKRKVANVLEDVVIDNKHNFKRWNTAKAGLRALDECVETNNNLYHRAAKAIEFEEIIHEMSIGNTLTMLIDKVKKTAGNLSDKEKVASRTLDTSLENFRTAIQNSLKQDNKEAVIRGDILPPASRIIKLALVSGFTFLINPCLTVIYLLGVFALSKGLRARERQIVLDEIDTELKVCKEYTEHAREKRDMEAYRNCLQIEKKLLRQRDKLNYQMKIAYRQDTQEKFSDSEYGKK